MENLGQGNARGEREEAATFALIASSARRRSPRKGRSPFSRVKRKAIAVSFAEKKREEKGNEDASIKTF